MKNNKKGISLIVLVITIIVIIILAAAVILTLNNNNPIAEANDARYASDTANMQAILTNTVAKIMAANQSTIAIETTTIKDNDDARLTRPINYTLKYPTAETNKTGVIVFDEIPSNQKNPVVVNEVITWYTGKELPDYTSGNEIWTVDTEGNLTLQDQKGNTYPEK